mmetsp:Transcript_6154/g.24818  ORF Transcript_6154/g.24818 Transcript_6154/m.24818 type:complete len:409 (-) Transcript_6154:1544-2770(-)
MPAQKKRSRSAKGGADQERAQREQQVKKRRIERDADGFIRTIDDEELPDTPRNGAPEQFGVMVQPEVHVDDAVEQDDAAVLDKKFSFDMTAGFASALPKKQEPKQDIQQPWDFSALTSAEAEQGGDQTTVDEKIARQREAMEVDEESASSDDSEEDDDAEEEEEEEDEEATESSEADVTESPIVSSSAMARPKFSFLSLLANLLMGFALPGLSGTPAAAAAAAAAAVASSEPLLFLRLTLFSGSCFMVCTESADLLLLSFLRSFFLAFRSLASSLSTSRSMSLSICISISNSASVAASSSPFPPPPPPPSPLSAPKLLLSASLVSIRSSPSSMHSMTSRVISGEERGFSQERVPADSVSPTKARKSSCSTTVSTSSSARPRLPLLFDLAFFEDFLLSPSPPPPFSLSL